jgi:hypothetical protein
MNHSNMYAKNTNEYRHFGLSQQQKAGHSWVPTATSASFFWFWGCEIKLSSASSGVRIDHARYVLPKRNIVHQISVLPKSGGLEPSESPSLLNAHPTRTQSGITLR